MAIVKPGHVQTKREIQELLGSLELRPRKRFGQHFLIDGNLMRKLAHSAEPNPDDLLLEVGAGTGGLTDLLVESQARVVCVEIDRDLCQVLSRRFASAPNFTLVAGDVLESKHRLRAEVARLIVEHQPTGDGCVKLVANLPYNVASPLVIDLLIGFPQVRRFCFTVQAEVAERIRSCSGSKVFGSLSIMAQALCRIETVARIPPQAFWPAPKVDSVMLRMDVGDSPFAEQSEVREFASLLGETFRHRRKKLRSALRYVLAREVVDALEGLLDLNRRPESLTIEEWLKLRERVSGSIPFTTSDP